MSKKKIKKKIHYGNNTNYNEEVKKLLIIIGAIIIIFLVIYLIIGIFVTKEIKFGGNDNNNTEQTVIQYSKILAGETFNQKETEYYVIFAEQESVNYSTYQLLSNNNSDKHIYIVDMDNPLNEKYKSDKSNSSANKVSELKINGDTMIKINNKQNVLYVEGVTQILNNFK